MEFLKPAVYLDEKFCVRSYEAGVTNHVSLAALCNYIAGIRRIERRPDGVGHT